MVKRHKINSLSKYHSKILFHSSPNTLKSSNRSPCNLAPTIINKLFSNLSNRPITFLSSNLTMVFICSKSHNLLQAFWWTPTTFNFVSKQPITLHLSKSNKSHIKRAIWTMWITSNKCQIFNYLTDTMMECKRYDCYTAKRNQRTRKSLQWSLLSIQEVPMMSFFQLSNKNHLKVPESLSIKLPPDMSKSWLGHLRDNLRMTQLKKWWNT